MTLLDDCKKDSKLTGEDKKHLGAINDLLVRSGIDIADIGRVDKVRVWQGFYKDNEGNEHKVDMHGVVLSPAWAEGPKWPLVQPAPAIKVTPSKVKPFKSDGWERAIVVPDIQIGYFRDRDDELVPTHDEAALQILLAVIRVEKPTQIVLVGDNGDLPEFSKYRLTPAFAQTTQPTLNRIGLLVAQLREAAGPDCVIVYLAGNHEERLPNYILDNAKAAFGLRQANTPESWPVMSVPFLCKFDDHGVEYKPGYPASSHWINDRLRVIHGSKHKSNGSTAHMYLATEKTSVIYGHIHRIEYAERTRTDRDGPKTIMAASPGCLARTDGAVPSTKGGTDLDGRPLVSHEDWQQGFAVVDFEPGDGRFDYHQVKIRDGWARHRDRDWSAT